LFHGEANALDFGARLGGEIRVVSKHELQRLREVVVELLKSRGQLDYGSQPLVFATQRRQPFRVAVRFGVAQLALYLTRAGNSLCESVAEAQVFFPAYFWRKRSTRPAVSISFCFPVKNG
jgi:hypothetical protein